MKQHKSKSKSKSDLVTSVFCFTETQPTPLVKDFDSFLQYIQQNPFSLIKTSGLIPYNHLAALNERMTQPNTENTPRTPQKYYPQLHLFYHLTLAGKLFEKTPKGSSIILKPTKRIDTYRSLSAAEKYFFLLETLWVDCSFGQLAEEHSETVIWYVEPFLKILSLCEPGKAISGNRVSLLGIRWRFPFFIHCFELFGWYKARRDEKRHQHYPVKSYFPVASLKPTALGVAISRILIEERPLEKWNLPYRKTFGEFGDLPGLSSEDKAKDYVPFFVAFQKLCQDKLQNTHPRKKREFVKGNFIFKVSLPAYGVWRKIAISSEDTLDDLHYAIQGAFDFDTDHLYAFFMDNRKWSEYSFESPHSEEGISADEVKIGDLDLVVNQHILYLFDFGDEWEFDVQLVEVKKGEPLLETPKTLEMHGDSPEQYPYAGDFEDFEDEEV